MSSASTPKIDGPTEVKVDATVDQIDDGITGLRRMLLLVATTTFVFAVAGLGARATYGAQVTADEPQYLLSALSLGEDGDLDISDELDEERFLDFHEVQLNPQTIELNDSGQRLSPHDPGLPVLLAIPMRLGGWQLAKVTLAAMAGLTAAATAWVSVRRFDVSPTTAGAVTVALFTTPPLTGYATQVYPEMPAALATIIGAAAVTGATAVTGAAGRRPSSSQQVVALTAIIVLPWLAVKYAPVAAVLAVALLLATTDEGAGRRRSPANAAIPLAVLATAGALYLLVHQRIYGGWTVYAAGDHFVEGEFLVVGSDPNYPGRTRRLIGLLVDRGWGLVAWAPTFIMLIPALAAMARRRRPGSLLIGSMLATGWAVATWIALTMHGWWWPGRQVVVVLPLAVVALAVFVDGRTRLFRVLLAMSLLAAVNWLWLVIEASSGRRTLIVDFTETASPLYRLWSTLLPNHRSPTTIDAVLTAGWLVLFVALGWLAWRDAGRPGDSPPQAAEAAAEVRPA